MYKILFFTALALFFVSNTFAQVETRFGLKGGMNISRFGGDSYFDDWTSRVDFHFGGVVEILLNAKFSLQPELLYSAQGSNVNYGARKTKLNYLLLPVMGKHYLIEGLSLEAGPVLGYLISAKWKGQRTSEGGHETVDVTDSFNTIDFALGIGSSYRLDMGMFFSLRYDFGLTNINSGESGKNKNNVAMFSVGYNF